MYVFEQVNIYILVAGLEALCVCSATKSSNGVIYSFARKSILYWVSANPGSNRVRIKVTIHTGWSPKVVC